MKNLIIGFVFGIGASGIVWLMAYRHSDNPTSSPTATETHRPLQVDSAIHKATSSATPFKSIKIVATEEAISNREPSGISKNTNKISQEEIPDSSAFEERMRTLERDTENKLGRLWEKELPRGQLTSRVEKEDGSVVEMEQTSKGDVISRQRKDGILLAVEWKTTGEKFLIRTYNPDGSEKGISVGSGQNAAYTFITDLRGSPTYKEYTNLDGSKYIARYENGRTTEQWYVTRDGKYVRIN